MATTFPFALPIAVTMAEDELLVDGASAQLVRRIVKAQAIINACGRGRIELNWTGNKITGGLWIPLDELDHLDAVEVADDLAAAA